VITKMLRQTQAQTTLRYTHRVRSNIGKRRGVFSKGSGWPNRDWHSYSDRSRVGSRVEGAILRAFKTDLNN
jgi:hypothetical protein